MNKKLILYFLIVLVLSAVFTGCSGKRNSFVLQSEAFVNNERIPDKYCRGNVSGRENISLPFNWVNPPNDVLSFALIVHDPDGGNWIHWAVFNIPPNYSEIEENASGKNMPEGSIELNNQFRTFGYGGPEPPRGSGTHGYIATLYALNTGSINDLVVYKSYAEINSILEGKVIAKADITGTYSASP